jgi:NAD(P)-dependent dehydrogenase (short-subunit alcohol dehydrogenase family)
MSWDPRLLTEQAGRTVVVTGANSGIGLEVTRYLVGRGANVVMAVRDPVKGKEAAASVAGRGRRASSSLTSPTSIRSRGASRRCWDAMSASRPWFAMPV